MIYTQVKGKSWNRFLTRGLAVRPDLMGKHHTFRFGGTKVTISLSSIDAVGRGQGYDVAERFCSHASKERLPVSSKLITTGAPIANGKEIPIHEQLKASITVHDFVSHYVQLSHSGTGLCPLHNDHVDSFSVDDNRNFWYCFACETGGSVIDFWMHYRDCDFRTAVDQLGTMLL